ncbi:MAG: glycerol-3-phosphate acyltransferase, partial [Erysipelotrichaceae bacterium]|nr:glycerol-3-phosphate acyltransferase [Erysipelotrichaceae bacterium]
MNTYVIRGLCLLIGYVFGCIHFAYIFGRSTKNIDIRDYGSGNSGTTNALRVLGTNWGLWTLLGDNCKAIAAIVIIGLIFGFDQKVYLI